MESPYYEMTHDFEEENRLFQSGYVKGYHDAVMKCPEIVRCKDCKWWNITSPTFPIKGFCGCYHGEHDGDWFCADGVVKDNCSEIPNN